MNEQHARWVKGLATDVLTRSGGYLSRREIWSAMHAHVRPAELRQVVEQMVQAGELEVREINEPGRGDREYRLVAVAQTKGGE